jgi:hypothetical protein
LDQFRYSGHNNKELEQCWQLDGPNGFHIAILEPISDELTLPEREDFWISRLDSLYPNGFNMRKNVNTRLSPNLARCYATNEPKWVEYWAETHARLDLAREKREAARKRRMSARSKLA